MAKKSVQQPAEIDPAAEYKVVLRKAIKVGPTWVRPGSDRIRLKGDKLLAHLDAVKDYTLVQS